MNEIIKVLTVQGCRQNLNFKLYYLLVVSAPKIVRKTISFEKFI